MCVVPGVAAGFGATDRGLKGGELELFETAGDLPGPLATTDVFVEDVVGWGERATVWREAEVRGCDSEGGFCRSGCFGGARRIVLVRGGHAGTTALGASGLVRDAESGADVTGASNGAGGGGKGGVESDGCRALCRCATGDFRILSGRKPSTAAQVAPRNSVAAKLAQK